MLSPQRFVQIAGLLLLVGGAGVCRAAADNRDGEDPAAKVKRYREQRATLLEQIKALEDKGANRTVEENAALAARLTQVRQVETSLANLIGGGPKLGEIKGAAPGGIGNNPGGIGTGTGGLDRAGAGTSGLDGAGAGTRGLDGAGAGTSGLDGAGAGTGLGEGKGPAPAGIRDNPGGLATGGAGTGPGEIDRGGTGLGESKGPAPQGIKDNPGGLATGRGPAELDTGIGQSQGPAPQGIKDNPGGLATGRGPTELDTGTGQSRGAAPEGIRQNPGDLATALERKPKPEDDKPNWGKEPKPVDGGVKDPAPKEPGPKGGGPKDPHPKEITTIGGLAATEEGIVPPHMPPPSEPPPKGGLAATEESLRPPRLPPGQPPPPPKAGLSASLAGRLMEGLSFGARDRKLDEATAREVVTALGAQAAKLHDSLGSGQTRAGPAGGEASPLGLGKLAQGLLSQPLQKREEFAAMAEGLERLLGSLQARLKGGAQDARGVDKGTANRSELGADDQGSDTARGDLKGAIAAELRSLGPTIDKQVAALGAYNDNWTPEQKGAYMGQLGALQNKFTMLSNLSKMMHEMLQGTIRNIR